MKGLQEHPRLGKALKLGTAGALGVSGATAVDKAATGQFPWEQFNQKPIATLAQKSPMPSETAYKTQLTETPTASPTATPIIEPSPTPKPSPTPSETPLPTPSATEVPPINEVPLDPDGVLKMEAAPYSPYYSLSGSRGTVTAKEYDPKTGTLIKIAVTFPGSKITKQNCIYGGFGSNVAKLCQFKGETLWLKIASRTVIDTPNHTQFGSGPDVLDKNTYVGKTVDFSIGLSPQITTSPYVTSADMKANVASFSKLQNDVGDSFPRSQQIFVFTPSFVTILT
jgi:hypothetical protein